MLNSLLFQALNPEDCDEERPSEARVEISRQCFDSFNRNFKTYEPILSAIKRDYDQLLTQETRAASETGPLRSRVAALELELEMTTERLNMKLENKERLAD